MLSSLPFLPPLGAHDLYLDTLNPSPFTGTEDQRPSQSSAPSSEQPQRAAAAAPNIHTSLQADENAILVRKANIRRFGAGWLKPPGIPKTLQGMEDERLEREEQEAAALREQALAEAQAAAAEAEAEANAEAAEGDRDLDEDIPDADDIQDQDDDDEGDEDGLSGDGLEGGLGEAAGSAGHVVTGAGAGPLGAHAHGHTHTVTPTHTLTEDEHDLDADIPSAGPASTSEYEDLDEWVEPEDEFLPRDEGDGDYAEEANEISRAGYGQAQRARHVRTSDVRMGNVLMMTSNMAHDLDEDVPDAGSYEHTDTEEEESSEDERPRLPQGIPETVRRSIGMADMELTSSIFGSSPMVERDSREQAAVMEALRRRERGARRSGASER